MKYFEKIERSFVYLSFGVLIIMMFYTFLDAFLRYFFNSPLIGTVEITEEYLMPMFVYFSISMVYATGGFVRVTILSERLPVGFTRIMMKVLDSLALVYVLCILYGAFKKTMYAIKIHQLSTSSLAYPMAPVFAVIMLGALLLSMRIILAIKDGHPENKEINEI